MYKYGRKTDWINEVSGKAFSTIIRTPSDTEGVNNEKRCFFFRGISWQAERMQ